MAIQSAKKQRRSRRSRVGLSNWRVSGANGGGITGRGQYHHTPDYPPEEGSADLEDSYVLWISPYVPTPPHPTPPHPTQHLPALTSLPDVKFNTAAVRFESEKANSLHAHASARVSSIPHTSTAVLVLFGAGCSDMMIVLEPKDDFVYATPVHAKTTSWRSSSVCVTFGPLGVSMRSCMVWEVTKKHLIWHS